MRETGIIFYTDSYEWRRKAVNELVFWCCNRCYLNASHEDFGGFFFYYGEIMRRVIMVYSLFKDGDLENRFYSRAPSVDK